MKIDSKGKKSYYMRLDQWERDFIISRRDLIKKNKSIEDIPKKRFYNIR